MSFPNMPCRLLTQALRVQLLNEGRLLHGSTALAKKLQLKLSKRPEFGLNLVNFAGTPVLRSRRGEPYEHT